MKSEKILHVPAAEVRRALTDAVTKQGAQNKVAADIGIHPQYLNNFLKIGNYTVPRKVLGWLGLEERKVYVKKESGDA